MSEKENKYNYTSDETEYKTPFALYNKAFQRWGIEQFGLDTCCSDENIPAQKYYKEGVDDGLTNSWENYSWCNPPFNQCIKWIKKAYNENIKDDKKIVMLLPVRTETKYWHDYILFNKRVTIQWLRKGYKFLNKNDEEMGIFKNALCLVYFE